MFPKWERWQHLVHKYRNFFSSKFSLLLLRDYFYCLILKAEIASTTSQKQFLLLRTSYWGILNRWATPFFKVGHRPIKKSLRYWRIYHVVSFVLLFLFCYLRFAWKVVKFGEKLTRKLNDNLFLLFTWDLYVKLFDSCYHDLILKIKIMSIFDHSLLQKKTILAQQMTWRYQYFLRPWAETVSTI